MVAGKIRAVTIAAVGDAPHEILTARPRRLDSLLIHGDERLMHDVLDEEATCPVHARQICVAAERFDHAEGLERLLRGDAGAERELGERKVDSVPAELTPNPGDSASRKRALDRVELTGVG